MLGDTAVAVHPDDERYRDLVGKQVELPLTGRQIPIIADEYVDPEFGTGCVKITPAHDFNDYEVGLRHSLPMIGVLDESAHLNENAPPAYRTLDRFVARERVLADLEAQGLLDRIEEHVSMLPRGERSGAVVEPMLTDQWYVRTQAACGAGHRGRRARAHPIRAGELRTRLTSTGCATSKTGASRASSGGAIGFQRGTTPRATSTWRATRPRRGRSTASAPIYRSRRTRTCSTPGFPRRSGRSRRSAGRTRPRSSRPSIPPACS